MLRQITTTTAAIMFAATLTLPFSGDCRAETDVDPAMMESLKRYLGMDEDSVIERLAQEAVAIESHSAIRGLMGDSYAGAWFSAEEGRLHVATTSPEKANLAKMHGAAASIVERNISELNKLRDALASTFYSRRMWGNVVRGLSIDVEANMVLVRHTPNALHSIEAALESGIEDYSEVRFEEVSERVTVSYDVRGADRYKNTDNGYGCSIGFSSNSGYLTAGHCGDRLDAVDGNNDQPQGYFEESTWPSSDLGLVDTNVSWSRLPKINGYTDGVLDVPEYWGGHLEGLINTTVCRYGKTTGGPHCGSILDRNVTRPINDVDGSTYVLSGLIETDACEVLGDSGGPLITSANGQAQGTLVGGYESTCPGTSMGSYFEPVSKHMIEFSESMLTPHGASSPSIHDMGCYYLGSGLFICIGDVSSQGLTSGQWTVNGVASGSGNSFSGACGAINQTVSIGLSVDNPYGTTNSSTSLFCAAGP